MPRSRAFSFAIALSGSLLGAAPALAHIDLTSPVPRAPGAPDTNLSQGPCGQRDNRRLADKVTTFLPGQTIDVVWDVYVQHVSYFRISFDADGDDSLSARPSTPSDPAADDPTALPAGDGETILAYVEDRTGSIDHVEQRVTLPNITCDNCTLQVIQFTYGLPLARATYHQCADLVLSGPLSNSAEPSEANADAAASGAVPPAGTRPEANAPGTGGPVGASDADSSDGGCAFRPASATPTPAWLTHGLVGLSLALAWRRRAERRRSRTHYSASDSIHCPSSST